MARCQTQTDTKPIAICSEILPSLCTRSAPLELFLQSLAKELLCVMQQNQLCSVLQFGTRIVLADRSAFYFYQQNRYSLRIHISHMGCDKVADSDRYKPIAICSEILPFLCTHTFPHMHVQLRLNFSSRALLKSCCVSCSKVHCA